MQYKDNAEPPNEFGRKKEKEQELTFAYTVP